MSHEWRYDNHDINWEELSTLYRIAPLSDIAPEKLKTAFSNSMFQCFIFSQGRLIGAGRVLADGADCAYLCDVAVHPDHQGCGLGKNIVMKLVAFSEGHRKIILYAAPGKEPFYKKLGFQRMNTAMAIFSDQQRALDMGLVSEA